MTFDALPQGMKNEYTQACFKRLQARRAALFCKRAFDIAASAAALALASPLLLALALAVKADSPGPVFFRQVRVGRWGGDFRIFKFRTMVQNAAQLGPAVTTGGDPRVTRVGRFIRRLRLDELSQLLNVLCGDMSFVGPRPEVPKYVAAYTPAQLATLLVRPGVTAPSSIAFKNEDELLSGEGDPDEIYVRLILPPKMALNLEYLDHISLREDIKVLFQTVKAVFLE